MQPLAHERFTRAAMRERSKADRSWWLFDNLRIRTMLAVGSPASTSCCPCLHWVSLAFNFQLWLIAQHCRRSSRKSGRGYARRLTRDVHCNIQDNAEARNPDRAAKALFSRGQYLRRVGFIIKSSLVRRVSEKWHCQDHHRRTGPATTTDGLQEKKDTFLLGEQKERNKEHVQRKSQPATQRVHPVVGAPL